MSMQLTPVSYHLRNFNKYVRLDLTTSKLGNLTLVGENAAGKTTLANCFFPMLIDGSIATPSFNAARDTEKVAQSTRVRNSQQDTRTFESMLLGWGPGAMKVRTGYSYLQLRSPQRQVILGIGAQRTQGVGGTTWWFVAISEAKAPLTVITTDAQGASLTEAAFVAANQALGQQLSVFKKADAYREFVATHVYGFSSEKELSQLANVYRLLASPILTGGNAKFSPIKAALREAQASIDREVIQAAAGVQREVNRKNGLLQRIANGKRRLQKIKSAIFWADLNHLNETKLSVYAANHVEFEQQKENAARAEAQVAKYSQQLEFLVIRLTDFQTELQQLTQKQAQQQVIVQQRQSLADQIKGAQNRLAQYEQAQAQLSQRQQDLAVSQTKLTQLIEQEKNVRQTALAPLQIKLNAHSAELHELSQVLAETSLATMVQQMAHYVRALRRQLTQYRNLQQQAETISTDVAIVGTMQNQMADSIDHRVQGPFGGNRLREGLQQDNQSIHEAGAAQMNSQFQQLKTEQAALLTAHPDLKVSLAQSDLLADLAQQQKQLAAIVTQLQSLTQQQAATQQAQANLQENIDLIRSGMEVDFDPAAIREQIEVWQQQHAQLVVDPELPAKLAETKQAVADLGAQKLDLETAKGQEQGQQTAAEKMVASKAAQLAALTTQIETMLTVLVPYLPAAVTLTTVDEVNTFVRAHGSEVRNGAYNEVAERIRRQVHRSDQNGLDRNALDTLLAERGYEQIASAMRQGSVVAHDMTTLAFDLPHVETLLAEELASVTKAVAELKTGNQLAQDTYLAAAVERIADQYQVIADYNRILAAGLTSDQGIKLKIELRPTEVSAAVITEACDAFATQRPALEKEVRDRLQMLANKAEIADDDAAFMQAAQEFLDTRRWSEFHVLIKRRQSGVDDFEEVDDKFVRSGGSGAEKAQAMVLPLLLVPKMLLERSGLPDVPYLVMFDEFADKLDPETAKSFAKTIANFGFDFIATMPSGAQNKLLADGVANVAYEVIAPPQQDDGRFYQNQVLPVLSWHEGATDD